MADRQFSIPAPWEESGPKTRVMIDCFGSGHEFSIRVGEEIVLFEWSEMFGPLPVRKGGKERVLSHRHKFWRIVSLWNLQGRRIESGECIWHEPRQPVLKHLGGRNYLIIEDGEEGHDW